MIDVTCNCGAQLHDRYLCPRCLKEMTNHVNALLGLPPRDSDNLLGDLRVSLMRFDRLSPSTRPPRMSTGIPRITQTVQVPPARLRAHHSDIALPASKSPISWEAAATAEATTRTLARLAAHVAELTGRPVTRPLSGWFALNLDRITTSPDAGVWAEEVRDAHRAVLQRIDAHDPKLFVGLCDKPTARVNTEPEMGPLCTNLENCAHGSCQTIYARTVPIRPVVVPCGGELYADLDATDLECPTCGTQYPVRERREVLLYVLADVAARPVVIARGITNLADHPVTVNQIAQWVRAGRLVAVGAEQDPNTGRMCPTYRVGDVQALAALTVERNGRKAQRERNAFARLGSVAGASRMAAGWFGSWRCDCTTIERRLDDVPARCPEHDRELLGRPSQVNAPLAPGVTYGYLAAQSLTESRTA